MIEWISELSKDDRSRFGEKASLLGELSKFGFPIPKGFAIPFSEYTEVFQRLETEINSALDSVDVNDVGTITSASRRISELFKNYRFSDVFKKDLEDFYSKLHIDKDSYGNVDAGALNFIKAGRDKPFVSIRVSTNSSTPKHFSTYLNVKRMVNIEPAIKKAWASIYSPYSILYRKLKKAPFPRPAIIIQEMVAASKSGDAFSLNPLNGDNSQFIIQARWGLSMKNSPGASIYICSKDGSKIVDSYENIPDNYYTNDSQSGVTALRTLEDEFKKIPLISEREVNLLSKIVGDIESRVGFPVHIEWGIERRKFKLLQVTPLSHYFKSRPTINFDNDQVKSSLNGLTSNSGTILNSKIKKLNENPERGDLVYSESFNGNLINSVIRSSGIIFENEDLTSFGSMVARDFDKPCMVKTKMSRINSEEPTNQPNLADDSEFSKDDLDRIRDLLSELENELIELNMRYSSERQSGKEVNNDKAKIISDLEWQIREVRTKINQNQQ